MKHSSQTPSRNKQLLFNLSATAVTTIINYCIAFLFTPYVIATVSAEAYGFVSLANDLVSYITIVTIALNSVAGRFITIQVHRKHWAEANKYFSSVLFANLFMAILVAAVAIPVICNLQLLLQVPTELIPSVKLLFVFIFINFMISLISTVFTVATFITNRLYLSSYINAGASILRVILLWALFGLLPPSIAFVGLVSVICSLATLLANVFLTRSLIPDFRPSISFFSLRRIRELLFSGIWNTVVHLSIVLAEGLDLLLSNLWIGAYAMGQLSIAYTIQTVASSVLSSIAALFSPKQMEHYAKGNIPGVLYETRFSIKLTGFFASILFCGVIVLGREFFNLWVPRQNIELIYVLSMLSILSVFTSGAAAPLQNVPILVNKLKTPSLVWLATGIFDILLVIILILNTNMGIYAVVAVSQIAGSIVNLTFVPIYAAACLKIKKSTFYPLILRYVSATLVMLGLFFAAKVFLPPATTWFTFICDTVCMCAIGMVSNLVCLLDRSEQKRTYGIIRTKLRRG